MLGRRSLNIMPVLHTPPLSGPKPTPSLAEQAASPKHPEHVAPKLVPLQSIGEQLPPLQTPLTVSSGISAASNSIFLIPG